MSQGKGSRTRRQFLQRSAAASAGVTLGLHRLAAGAPSCAVEASEAIRVGFVGVGNRGSQLLREFLRFPDARVVALCDVYRPYLERDFSKVAPELVDDLGGRVPRLDEDLPPDVKRFTDFRRLIDREDIDAVVIATPDHWHAVQAIAALEAGKDVYVEKPLSITIREGQKMVETAERTGRVVQVGLQRRSSGVFRDLARDVAGGIIGPVSVARAYRISNMFPRGIGKAETSAPPAGLDWDLWLGPRPFRPYRSNMALYKFRWFRSFSSQIANWGVHYFDAIRWMLGERAPVSISAHGTRSIVDDDRTIPVTAEVTFEFASGRLLVFGQYEASGGSALASGEIELRGTKGNLYCSSRGYSVVPSEGGQFQERGARGKASENLVPRQRNDADHVRDFLDCVRSRKKCHCDMETGHRSTTFALLANIALEAKSRIEWDPERERIQSPSSANDLLHYEYREPWKL